MNSRPPATASAAGSAAQPVDVRLMGDDRAVRALVAALQQAAACGPASYRTMRDGNGTRAYLSVIVPADPTPAT
ncbi:hypothetical protein GTY20_09130 [Streptomyces sp. SID4946]|uniref:hypothetical protein n=1 Tax=Streptomyces sp. LamerLS-31b TaxID=1839765 RepID=UPI00081DCC9F|nr:MULTISPECIES: hypothetical protein [unclassified Streptomyces]MYQ91479.1 hypothetical protein [Streptomyces sp. SID4946]SCF67817.1 hypothetical protein GA0115256_111332 [Streptomyces sp. DconLS]SCF75542.1 hypothetical protein GA0115258_11163 [Streptomyces sp. LamerLS-31b]